MTRYYAVVYVTATGPAKFSLEFIVNLLSFKRFKFNAALLKTRELPKVYRILHDHKQGLIHGTISECVMIIVSYPNSGGVL